MDYIRFCENFYDAFHIPVNLLKDDQPVYSSLAREIRYLTSVQFHVYTPDKNPEFVAITPDLQYGHVRIEGSGYDLIIGPAFPVRPSDELVRLFMLESQLPNEYRESIAEALYAIPLISQNRFCSLLCFLHQTLNGKIVEPDYFLQEDAEQERARRSEHVRQISDALDNESRHSSYAYEQELWRLVREGNVQLLQEYMSSNQSQGQRKLAQTPLRHAKNEFIVTVEKAGLLGAIPSGMDAERVYQLIDMYIQECEQLQRTDDVHKLEYVMLLDFCRRSGEAHIPNGLSAEVFQCASFIRERINMPISAEDVARHIHRSRSYTMARFKKEMGLSIGEYMTRCRVNAAKSLLADSDKPLAEISLFLCYSSQSHFQNVFKAETGMTPMQYRKEHRVSAVYQ